MGRNIPIWLIKAVPPWDRGFFTTTLKGSSILPHATNLQCTEQLLRVSFNVACEQRTHFRSSLLSLRKIAIFRKERSDDRKCVCCSQATFNCDCSIFLNVPLCFEIARETVFEFRYAVIYYSSVSYLILKNKLTSD